MENVNKQLLDVAEKLKKAGAAVPAPQAGGTIESAMRHGLSIALVIVEEAIAAAEQAHQAEPAAWMYTDGKGSGYIALVTRRWRAQDVGAWVETPLYAQPPAVAVPDGWDAESVRLAFSTLRYIIGLEPDGIKAPFDHVQDIIEKVASWSDMGPCHPVRKQYEAAAAHRAMLAAAQKGGA